MSIQSILSASQSITSMKALQSARTRMQGTANVLRTESKLDDGDAKKESEADSLVEKSDKLMSTMMDEFDKANEAFKADEDIKTEADGKEEAKEAEKTKNPTPADTVELSDSAAKLNGENPPAKVVSGDTVTYKSDGSVAQSARGNNAFKFEAIA